ncbi:MAG: hypothetical protein Ct9H300mP29_2390 [Candidatus Neomarinimicrobiota bacterium]|nr:MAG: hypothetical protein Ct9H300mP29_2390 [Candidatus Neomarinimicrobiota bacterium]
MDGKPGSRPKGQGNPKTQIGGCMNEFSHLDKDGKVRMVDVTDKTATVKGWAQNIRKNYHAFRNDYSDQRAKPYQKGTY